jgi:serine O-acetyltransferase
MFPAASTTTGKQMSTIKKIIGSLQIPRGILHILLLSMSPVRSVIEKDVDRWLQETGLPEQSRLPRWRSLVWLLWRCPAFRNLFYHRIAREERFASRVILELAKFLYTPMETLYIYTPTIGAGLFIQHGFSTIISARSIGQNCWINQQVTIGFSDLTDTPTIGDNVRITAGAKVFGNITIGNNSIIGANAVVFKDVPPNCTVVGVPAYIVKRDGKKVRKPL